jgi:hypothetical protein
LEYIKEEEATREASTHLACDKSRRSKQDWTFAVTRALKHWTSSSNRPQQKFLIQLQTTDKEGRPHSSSHSIVLAAQALQYIKRELTAKLFSQAEAMQNYRCHPHNEYTRWKGVCVHEDKTQEDERKKNKEFLYSQQEAEKKHKQGRRYTHKKKHEPTYPHTEVVKHVEEEHYHHHSEYYWEDTR